MKTSQLDLDFARAQYGEEAVAGFDKALATSRDELSRAFTLRQQLDDDVPEDEPTTRQMLGEMLRLTEAADARLDEQAGAFARAARPGEHRPAGARRARPADRRAARPASRRRSSGWPQLQQRFAAAAVAPVADNVTEARARLAAAEQEVQEARAALAAGRDGHRRRRHPRGRGRRRADRPRCWTPSAGWPPTSTRPAAGWRPCARRRRRTSPRPARSPASGDRSGLRPQIARAEAALTSADELLAGRRPRPTRWRPCGSSRRPTSRWSRR